MHNENLNRVAQRERENPTTNANANAGTNNYRHSLPRVGDVISVKTENRKKRNYEYFRLHIVGHCTTLAVFYD